MAGTSCSSEEEHAAGSFYLFLGVGILGKVLGRVSVECPSVLQVGPFRATVSSDWSVTQQGGL